MFCVWKMPGRPVTSPSGGSWAESLQWAAEKLAKSWGAWRSLGGTVFFGRWEQGRRVKRRRRVEVLKQDQQTPQLPGPPAPGQTLEVHSLHKMSQRRSIYKVLYENVIWKDLIKLYIKMHTIHTYIYTHIYFFATFANCIRVKKWKCLEGKE